MYIYTYIYIYILFTYMCPNKQHVRTLCIAWIVYTCLNLSHLYHGSSYLKELVGLHISKLLDRHQWETIQQPFGVMINITRSHGQPH